MPGHLERRLFWIGSVVAPSVTHMVGRRGGNSLQCVPLSSDRVEHVDLHFPHAQKVRLQCPEMPEKGNLWRWRVHLRHQRSAGEILAQSFPRVGAAADGAIAHRGNCAPGQSVEFAVGHPGRYDVTLELRASRRDPFGQASDVYRSWTIDAQPATIDIAPGVSPKIRLQVDDAALTGVVERLRAQD